LSATAQPALLNCAFDIKIFSDLLAESGFGALGSIKGNIPLYVSDFANVQIA
jgi:hypothetical protein